METRLLVSCVQDSGFAALVRGERGGEVKLETFGDEVVKLDLVAEDVGGGPSLGEGETVDLVGPFTLNVTMDGIGLGIAGSLDLEGDVGGGLGLDLERGATEVVVLAEQVIGRLAEILMKVSEWSREYNRRKKKKKLPSRKGERVVVGTCWVFWRKSGDRRVGVNKI